MGLTQAALRRRLDALESVDDRHGGNRLPVIVEEHELHSPSAMDLQQRGFTVLTFEQCCEEMV